MPIKNVTQTKIIEAFQIVTDIFHSKPQLKIKNKKIKIRQS